VIFSKKFHAPLKIRLLEKSYTLRELINAELIIAELIFADEESNKAYFAELIFADSMS